MNFRSWLGAIRKSWWVVLICVLLGAGLAGLFTLRTPSLYASSVTFFVRTPAEQIGGAYQGDQFAQKRVNSYVQLAESQRLASLVVQDTQLPLSAAEVSSMITAKGDLNTVLLTVTVSDTDAERSLDVARSVSRQFVELVSQLETPPGASSPTVSLDVTSEATLNPKPVSPRPLFNLLIGAVIGLLVGIAIAVVRSLIDSSIRSVDELRRLAGGVLAAVPFDTTAKASPLITESHSRSVRAEALRQLRTNLLFADVDEPVKVIVVTSSLPDEGKSSTAVNLAVAFSEAGSRVLLIEGDLRKPSVSEYLDLDGSVGLTNVLAGQVSLDDVLQTWGKGGLSVLPCGSIPPNPSELLSSRNMRELLSSVRDSFDMVIVDTPPLLPVTDAALVASAADGAVIVVRHGRTTHAQVRGALENLHSVNARVLGAVLNMLPKRENSTYGYGAYENSGDGSRVVSGPDSDDPRQPSEVIPVDSSGVERVVAPTR